MSKPNGQEKIESAKGSIPLRLEEETNEEEGVESGSKVKDDGANAVDVIEQDKAGNSEIGKDSKEISKCNGAKDTDTDTENN